MFKLVAFLLADPSVYGSMPVDYYTRDHCESRIEMLLSSDQVEVQKYHYECFEVRDETRS